MAIDLEHANVEVLRLIDARCGSTVAVIVIHVIDVVVVVVVVVVVYSTIHPPTTYEPYAYVQ